MSEKTLWHCTPDLFISSYLHCMDSVDPCWNPSWSSQSFVHHHILCDLQHGIHGVQEMQVSIKMTHSTELVHRLLSGVLKLGLHVHHGSGEGDIAQPQPIHWPFNESLTNSHSQGEMRCSTILWKRHLLHNPIVAWLWYNIIPHLILTYSMVQSPSWEANWSSASQEIPRILWNPKVHYRTHKPPPPVPILGQPNPVHIPTSHLLEILPNIIHPSMPRSPQWSLSLRFPHQDYTPPSPHPYVPHA